MVADAFSYPLRGSGRLILIIGAVLSALLDLATSAPLLGLAAWMMGGAYFIAYYFDIMVTTVSGSDEPPDFPDISDLFGDILEPLLRSLAALLISHLPLILVVLMNRGENPLQDIAVWAALAFAAFYFPMAILNVAVSSEAAAALPHRVFPDIVRAMPRYLLLVVLLGGVFLVSRLAAAVRIPVVSGLVSAGISLYFMMVQARLAAMFYRSGFQRGDEEPEPAGATEPQPSPPVGHLSAADCSND